MPLENPILYHFNESFLISENFSHNFFFETLGYMAMFLSFVSSIFSEEIWFHFTSRSIKLTTAGVPGRRQRGTEHRPKTTHFRWHSRLQFYQNWNQRNGKWYYLDFYSYKTDGTDQCREMINCFLICRISMDKWSTSPYVLGSNYGKANSKTIFLEILYF